MVSEIAPIVLYLRYLVDPWELLIIEEPESHLHPQSQVALAQAVTDMVAGEVRVLLTTHSDYFLNRLNNALRAETIRRQRSTSEDASSGLSFEDVAAYNFTRGRAGTVVRPLDVSPTEGVSDEEFARVAEYLYEQTVQLEEEIQG